MVPRGVSGFAENCVVSFEPRVSKFNVRVPRYPGLSSVTHQRFPRLFSREMLVIKANLVVPVSCEERVVHGVDVSAISASRILVRSELKGSSSECIQITRIKLYMYRVQCHEYEKISRELKKRPRFLQREQNLTVECTW